MGWVVGGNSCDRGKPLRWVANVSSYLATPVYLCARDLMRRVMSSRGNGVAPRRTAGSSRHACSTGINRQSPRPLVMAPRPPIITRLDRRDDSLGRVERADHLDALLPPNRQPVSTATATARTERSVITHLATTSGDSLSSSSRTSGL